MQNTLNNIVNFLRNPDCELNAALSIKQKINTVLHVLVFSFIIAILLGAFISLLEYFKIVDLGNHANSLLFEDYSPLVVLFLVAILAPLIEELIFRAPITLFCEFKGQFKYIFYAFAILFGYIHIFNFEIKTTIIILSPILVLPQIVLGLFLGYLRVKFGLLYSILLHALYNGILTIPVVLLGDI